MSKTITPYNNVNKWGVSLAEFEAGGFGSLMKNFKAPNSLLREFSTQDPKTKQLVPDLDTIFNEMAEKIIQAMIQYCNILQRIKMEWLPDELIQDLKRAVYLKIAQGIRNRTIMEIINGAGISYSNYTYSQDTFSWGIIKDYLGMECVTLLDTCGIFDYEIVDEAGLIARTKEGNVLVLGWIDISKFPELY